MLLRLLGLEHHVLDLHESRGVAALVLLQLHQILQGAERHPGGSGQAGRDGEDRPDAGRGDRKDPPPRQRPGVYHDAPLPRDHQDHQDEAGGE